MNWVDFTVISILIVVLGLIIFFSFVLPRIKGVPVECASCPASKHAKKYLKKYRKLKKKELKNK